MNLAPFIDHTLLRQDATRDAINQLCREAAEAGFAAACVPSWYVAAAAKALKDTDVKVATVIGFPFGYHLPSIKTTEAEMACISGAAELDMVINIAALKSGEWNYLENEIRDILEVVKLHGRKLKVIVESGILTQEELEKCCALYSRFDIDFMKTSTGYAAVGATVEAVQTMRQLLPARIAIKASGGIKTYAFAKELIDAGATRIGTSAGLQLIAESKN